GTTVHFVTHSMGGIVVRAYLKEHPLPNLGRVVMLTPPSQGTELADRLQGHPFLKALCGPAGLQMTTAADGFPRSLGPVDYELGVIAGDRSINPFFSQLIPGPDDGVIAVERTRVEGMTAFLVLPYSHTFIMNRSDVLSEVIHFLRKGKFTSEGPRE
ncbi:MAG: alpha/beta hydrolase, partial [Candidatus Neomarinimicrobiota bacterium]